MNNLTHLPHQPQANILAKQCPSRHLLARIGDKWSVMALRVLSEQPLRFGAIKRQCEGVSQKMLTQTLRGLEENGLILRIELQKKPLQVSYELTDSGRELEALLQPLVAWVHAYTEQTNQNI